MEHEIYQALQSYIPAPDDIEGLAVQKDDLLVINPTKSSCRNGWMYAFNRCTGTAGFVPVEIIKQVEKTQDVKIGAVQEEQPGNFFILKQEDLSTVTTVTCNRTTENLLTCMFVGEEGVCGTLCKMFGLSHMKFYLQRGLSRFHCELGILRWGMRRGPLTERPGPPKVGHLLRNQQNLQLLMPVLGVHRQHTACPIIKFRAHSGPYLDLAAEYLIFRKLDSFHRLFYRYVVKPILCVHCGDYIWGPGKVLHQCEGMINLIRRHLVSMKLRTTYTAVPISTT